MNQSNINNENEQNHSENHRSEGPRGRRPEGAGRRGQRRSQDPFAQLANELPGFLANAISSFAPTDGPGISVFDFNPGAFTPLSETLHDGDDFVVRVELPGVSEKDILVELNNNRLVIAGEKKEVVISEESHKKLQEVRYGSFKRVYPVPSSVTSGNVSAEFKEGILVVRVKDALKKSEGIKIKVATK